jgi:hypothetical protein
MSSPRKKTEIKSPTQKIHNTNNINANQYEWLDQEENILKSWGEICACYSWLHDKSRRKYNTLSMAFSLQL